MQDIKRPSRSSRYNSPSTKTAPVINLSPKNIGGSSFSVNSKDKIRAQKLSKMAEDFEINSDRDYSSEYDNNNGGEEEYYTDKKRDFYEAYRKSNTEASNQGVRKLKRNNKNRNRFIALLAVLAAFLFLYTFVFNSATIIITSKTLDKKVKDNYLLENSDSSKAFEAVSLEKTIEKEIARSKKEKVVSKASGLITIYNNFGESTQKLIKNTRFETKDGKVFRIADTVVVPGKVGNTPGKVQIKVTADSVGESYNVGATTFTIPGFKGSARYDGFYAKSESAMSGGANSEKSIVSKDDIALATNEMTIELKDKIKQDLVKVNKDNYIELKDEIYYVITNNLSEFESGKADKFKLFAKAEMLLIDKNILAKTILKKEDVNYKNDDVYIKNINDISFKKLNQNMSLINATSVSLYAEGLPNFVYRTDINSLKNDIVGKDNTDTTFSSVLSKYTSIGSAKSKIAPFWVSSYPSNKNKINIIQE